MADIENRSTSSREEDPEKASDSVDLNKNITAKSVCPGYRRVRVLATYSFFV